MYFDYVTDLQLVLSSAFIFSDYLIVVTSFLLYFFNPCCPSLRLLRTIKYSIVDLVKNIQ